MSHVHAWCNRILEGLLSAGVTELIVSPGSRSTPMLLAALASPIVIHSVIDERSAGFFALGRARARRQPVALLCTSGSAGAHYLPAFLEARYARHVLIALTADRPPELLQSGANQTIDQSQLLAAACPCISLGMPDSHPDSGPGVRRRVQQAIALATGPVHFNLPFRKPLEPDAGPADKVKPSPAPAIAAPRLLATASLLEELASQIQGAKRGLIVAGPTDSEEHARAILRLANHTGFVLLAEATSGARFTREALATRCDMFPHILESNTLGTSLTPDLVLQLGAEPCNGALQRWLAKHQPPTFRFSESQIVNRSDGSMTVVLGDLAANCGFICAADSSNADTKGYLQKWQTLNTKVSAIVSELQSQSSQFCEASALAQLTVGLPEGSTLTIGNSLSIRSIDMMVQTSPKQLRILHQRGTSGIDGLIAGAIGSSDTGPSTLVLGDVSCSHDSASLALAHLTKGPLGIVCIDNGGGQIFSYLPISKQSLPAEQWDLWKTPPSLDYSELCKAYGVAYRKVTSLQEVEDATAWLHQAPCSFLHICLPQDGLRRFQQHIQSAIALSS